MIVTVIKSETQLEVEKELKVTSVILERRDDNKLSMFYCPNCSNPLIQHKGRIAYIYPGEVPCNMPLIAECRRCKERYLFRTNV